MDLQPQTTQSISDDQELAKVLAGVNQQADEALEFGDTMPTLTPAPAAESPASATPPTDTTMPTPTAAPVGYTPPVMPAPTVTSSAPTGSSDLESIKKDALQELRPLVDKLDLAPEEKFDTYLLLLRSTDDKALIAPAYTAAQAISDEARRAQALLDVIKEIDYLSAPSHS